MAVKGARDYRPKFHYTPEKGWINDPNGLIYYRSKWHLFAQYYPDDSKWGPMHWAHAVSDDLIHWEHLPGALYPDELGMCFSGSAAEIDGKMCLMYTSHGDKERQSVAFSDDGVNFTKYAKNPVIENPNLPDFRDPKMFRNPIRGGYTVSVAAGKSVYFYHSNDLVNWTKTGEFSDQERCEGTHECPDLFPLNAPNGEKVWVMIASMCHSGGGNRTQYLLGDFDGDKFINTKPFDEPEWIEAGWSNYAPVTFFGADRPVIMGWGRSWDGAEKMPTGNWAGAMTFARNLALVETEKGLRLAQTPILPEEAEGGIESECFHINISAEGKFSFIMNNESGEKFIIESDGENIIIDTRRAGEWGALNDEEIERIAFIKAKRKVCGKIDMDIVFDVSQVEIFADNGLFTASIPVFPIKLYSNLCAEGCKIKFVKKLINSGNF